jgi:urease accessory protein
MKKSLLIFMTLMGLPLSAMAHPGHDAVGFMSGVLHPLTGLDHLLVMLAIGFWAARAPTLNRFQIPALFISFLLVGLTMGAFMGQSNIVEMGIAVSVIAMGVVLLLSAKINVVWQIALTSVFGLMHGFVHGQELILANNGLQAIIGLVLTTSVLLLIGFVLGNQKDSMGRYLQSLLVSVLTVAGTFFLIA